MMTLQLRPQNILQEALEPVSLIEVFPVGT